jgi:hypothetical protein
LDWVGVDEYPGTWGARLPPGVGLGASIRDATIQTFRAMRDRFMPQAGIPQTIPIHVTESGYPTGRRRSEGTQVTALRASVGAVIANAARFGVATYSWFDLRDADSDAASFENHYGLMTDDYVAKPAFEAYRKLIAVGAR